MKLRARKFFAWILCVVLTLGGMEMVCQLAFRMGHPEWYWQVRRRAVARVIEVHPYYGADLAANVTLEDNGLRFTHNSHHCRGQDFVCPKPAGLTRIVAMGGSSTYCAGVSDDQTWEYYLQRDLGTNYEVINMAFPGGTSLESMIKSAFVFIGVQPDYAFYYLGWNDAQVQHVKDLAPDWADSHGKLVTSGALNGRGKSSPTALGYFIQRMAFAYFFPHMDTDYAITHMQGTADAFTDRVDQRALNLYERNLRLIVAVDRRQGVEPVFIPQMMNYDILTSETPYGWLPFLRDKDLKKIIGAYNDTMARVAKEEHVRFVSEMLDVHFQQSDFLDQGHFSPAGNRLFAQTLARVVPGKPAITNAVVAVH